MGTKTPTLCWDCAKACGDCSWSRYREFVPVPGWKAVKVRMKTKFNGDDTSYQVIECPEFEPDVRWSTAEKAKKSGDFEKL